MTDFIFRVFSVGPKRMRVMYPVAFVGAVVGGVTIGLRLHDLLL